jgi:ribulose-phosphate 3-epimerase
MPRIAPSILGADAARLADEIADATSAGIDIFHLDIMDGHFVPNLSFGPSMVKTVDRLTDAYLDVHLMLSEPEKYFEPFVEAGSDNVTFHIEVLPDPAPQVARLRELGVDTGISLNPDHPIESVFPHLESFDYLLIMSVFAGFGGQAFIESSYGRIEAARKFIDGHGLATRIEVDGGVDESNARRVLDAGADVLVMGTGFFGARNRRDLVATILGPVA